MTSGHYSPRTVLSNQVTGGHFGCWNRANLGPLDSRVRMDQGGVSAKTEWLNIRRGKKKASIKPIRTLKEDILALALGALHRNAVFVFTMDVDPCAAEIASPAQQQPRNRGRRSHACSQAAWTGSSHLPKGLRSKELHLGCSSNCICPVA